MQAFLLLWTVAAAGLALSAPLEESATVAEYTMASDVSRLGKRGMKEDRAGALDNVTVWGTDYIDACIEQHNAEKYRRSAKEVATQFAEYCKPRQRLDLRPSCEEMADILFRANDHEHPSGIRRIAKIMNHHIKATGSGLVHGAQGTSSRAWSWAKSIFNRPSAFQSPVREEEGAAVMHPIRPVIVPE
ncbi:MAG: hypothetical protein M1826_006322 [Phylliscum demangeonii]|nr:MAG: hypothetical protein M1826_006322 [Phylliscum demangeonii]